MRIKALIVIAFALLAMAVPARAQSDNFLGQIDIVAFSFAPKGWAFCDGQIMPISQNVALFSLLGTTFGGDGRSTFALPDFRGRMAVGAGQGPGLSLYELGQVGGEETVTLTLAQLPAHSHAAVGGGAADSLGPSGTTWGTTTTYLYSSTGSGLVGMNSGSIGATGGSGGVTQPHDNMPPYLVLNFIIALQGVFPARS